MRHYLVVAHRTLIGPHVLAWVQERAAEEPSQFHLVVPVSPNSSLTWTEGELRAEASRRLDEGLAALRELGIEATGEVGDGHPVAAVLDVFNRGDVPVDEVLLSTLPPGPSRWLRMDAPRRLAQAVAVPVTHLVAPRRADVAS
jgi:hypothetical protein